ncbi:MAG: TIGR00701 family protein [Geminicoccaceae bacterium]|nr:MAG: TIGR00701 family protein [Geminicoccaceae bacterium]
MMTDPWAWSKLLHFLGLTVWMAGLWGLLRLYAGHHALAVGSEASERAKATEQWVLKVVTTPAMVVTFVAGVVLIQTGVGWTPGGWLHTKLTLLVLLGGVHGVMAADRKKFAADQRPRSPAIYHLLLAVSFVLFAAIAFLAVFRSF